MNEELRKSGPSTPVELSPRVENVGVEPVHEDAHMERIQSLLADTGVALTKEAVPISTQPTELIVDQGQATPTTPTNLTDTKTWWAKMLEKQRQQKERGLPHAA